MATRTLKRTMVPAVLAIAGLGISSLSTAEAAQGAGTSPQAAKASAGASTAGSSGADSSVVRDSQLTASLPSTGTRVIECQAVAEDPFTLTATSKDIHALGRVTGCNKNPDSCKLSADLEQYNGNTGTWSVVSRTDGDWVKNCKKGWFGGRPRTDSVYTCTHTNDTQWAYRTVIEFAIEEDDRIKTEVSYSTNNKLYWCF
ncbi:hypothetical protein G5C51_27375 [Streptomyces sp. A7024]|uniref:Secreted protein n=1 Tax=Streptomyces coryli TaxID=1128680 RepID=A0A6G4U6J1_9ACTN|nr:hypothetical protein [Streptomyces coryli]NGN67612.1 hypothetical protein [Streptomyces coryli]